MDQETFHKLKKGNARAKAALCREHMNRTWFLCYQLTQDTRTAAPLLFLGKKTPETACRTRSTTALANYVSSESTQIE